jgi:hypothetical protein
MLGVSDTSPINYLVLIQQEILLPALYGRVGLFTRFEASV